MNLWDALNINYAEDLWLNDELWPRSAFLYTEERLAQGEWISDTEWKAPEGGIHTVYRVSPQRRSRAGQYLRRIRRLSKSKH